MGFFFPEMVVLAISNILVCIFIVFLVLFTYQKSGAESQKVSVALYKSIRCTKNCPVTSLKTVCSVAWSDATI